MKSRKWLSVERSDGFDLDKSRHGIVSSSGTALDGRSDSSYTLSLMSLETRNAFA